MPFQLTEVVNDPDIGGEHFTIYRSQGQFGPGGWQNQTTQVPGYGVVQVATQKALQMVPEGDKIAGALEVHTAQPMYTTSEGGSNISDQILWQGNMYRLISLGRWNNYGFYVSILDRMTGS